VCLPRFFLVRPLIAFEALADDSRSGGDGALYDLLPAGGYVDEGKTVVYDAEDQRSTTKRIYVVLSYCFLFSPLTTCSSPRFLTA
jgi:hypothetical protein